MRGRRPTADNYLIIVRDVECVYHTRSYDPLDLSLNDQAVVDGLVTQPRTIPFTKVDHALFAVDDRRRCIWPRRYSRMNWPKHSYHVLGHIHNNRSEGF